MSRQNRVSQLFTAIAVCLFSGSVFASPLPAGLAGASTTSPGQSPVASGMAAGHSLVNVADSGEYNHNRHSDHHYGDNEGDSGASLSYGAGASHNHFAPSQGPVTAGQRSARGMVVNDEGGEYNGAGHAGKTFYYSENDGGGRFTWRYWYPPMYHGGMYGSDNFGNLNNYGNSGSRQSLEAPGSQGASDTYGTSEIGNGTKFHGYMGEIHGTPGEIHNNVPKYGVQQNASQENAYGNSNRNYSNYGDRGDHGEYGGQ